MIYTKTDLIEIGICLGVILVAGTLSLCHPSLSRSSPPAATTKQDLNLYAVDGPSDMLRIVPVPSGWELKGGQLKPSQNHVDDKALKAMGVDPKDFKPALGSPLRLTGPETRTVTIPDPYKCQCHGCATKIKGGLEIRP